MQIDYLAIVWRTLQKYRVPEYAYSLGSEDDEKVNLFYADRYWIVTNVERGTRCFEKQFEDVNAAVAQFFDELSVTEFRYKRMNRFFLKNASLMKSYKGESIDATIDASLRGAKMPVDAVVRFLVYKYGLDAKTALSCINMHQIIYVVQCTLQRFRIPERIYALSTESDERINFFYEDAHWVITSVERGSRQFEAEYDDANVAAASFFSKLSGSRLKIKLMERYFQKKLKKLMPN
jgi:hypothetical protein